MKVKNNGLSMLDPEHVDFISSKIRRSLKLKGKNLLGRANFEVALLHDTANLDKLVI